VGDIITERSGSILRVQLNRPAKKNAMTSSMYVGLAVCSMPRQQMIAHMSFSGMAPEIHFARATTWRTSSRILLGLARVRRLA
jgi:hypothetical protein